MIQVKRIQSESFTSNVYVITSSLDEEVILIDSGGYQGVIDTLGSNTVVKGIFLTHYHYDHIYYMQAWSAKFPDVIFYGSKVTLDGISDPKNNLSFYHDNPVYFQPKNSRTVSQGQSITLFNDISILIHETDGHCEGSLTFVVENFIFTGDALIPNVPVVTKLRTGNKLAAKNSVRYIRSLCTDHTLICAGHMEIHNANEVNWGLYFDD